MPLDKASDDLIFVRFRTRVYFRELLRPDRCLTVADEHWLVRNRLRARRWGVRFRVFAEGLCPKLRSYCELVFLSCAE